MKALITRKEFEDIFENTNSKWEGDNAFKGLQILTKYYAIEKDDIIQGADHDVLYSVDVDDIIKRGITKEDAQALAKLNWHIEHDEYLAVFV